MPLAPDEKIDWFRIITELRNECGQSNRSIGIAIGIPSRSLLQRWMDGSSPRTEVGIRLIEFYKATSGKDKIPVIRRYDFRA